MAPPPPLDDDDDYEDPLEEVICAQRVRLRSGGVQPIGQLSATY